LAAGIQPAGMTRVAIDGLRLLFLGDKGVGSRFSARG
jgi:hypothetical protein